MNKHTKLMLSEAHGRYASSEHRNAYLTMLWFAMGKRNEYCRWGHVRYWRVPFGGF